MGYNQDTWKISKFANTAIKLNFSYEKYMRQQLENKTVVTGDTWLSNMYPNKSDTWLHAMTQWSLARVVTVIF